MLPKILFRFIIILLGSYTLICLLLYFMQERLLFIPDRLAKDHVFDFGSGTEELQVKTNDGKILSALLFKADSTKGLLFYLHGNAGALNSWGEEAEFFQRLGYDVFMLDYRGYGKSEGYISNEKQLFEDVQAAYDTAKRRYPEKDIVVLGYSIGSGMAAQLASTNNPKHLILLAPYYSMIDLVRNKFKVLPSFILKYKLETYKYLAKTKAPTSIFHGRNDEVIYVGSSLKLKTHLKSSDTLILLDQQGHNGISEHIEYRAALKKIL